MNEMLWVAVPGGTARRALEGAPPVERVILRALAVPRFDVSEPTALDRLGLTDWPAILARAALTAEVAATLDGSATPLRSTRASVASSNVWKAFFAPGIPVNPRRRLGYEAPFVPPTTRDAQRVVGTYRTSARAFVRPGANVEEVVGQQYLQWQDDGPAGGSAGQIVPEVWQKPDFNRAVSFLREHPAVLKELGLIVELSIDVEDLLVLPSQTRLIRVRFTPDAADASLAPTPVTPWTRFTFDGRRFLPAPEPDSDLRQGMVDLTRAAPIGDDPPASRKWSVVTFDVDGGVGRLRDAARSRGAADGAAANVTLPVLHSAGIGLVRNGRGDLLRRRANNSARGNASADILERELFAEDLVLGYRVDIKGESGGWRSVCARIATYTIGGLPIGAASQPEEGHVKANAAVVGADRVLRADEIVARWTGWNLAMPRPVFDEMGVRPDQGLAPELPFNLVHDFQTAPLPQLRFGESYFLRMRVADMAGGGIAVEDDPTSEEFATSLVLYRRHEAVPPPEIAPPAGMFILDPRGLEVPNPAVFGPGGTIDVLVIRSDPEGDTPLDVAGFGAANPGYPRNDTRTIVPPPTTLTIAEQYDALNGEDETTWNWVRRTMVPPAVTPDGQYTWLADPASIGVVAAVRADAASPAPGALGRSRWVRAWPDHLPKTVRLLPPSPASPVIQWTATTAGPPEDTDSLAVRLKPGDQADIELSSFPASNAIDKFEISDWVSGSDQSLLVQGRHPMMTPPRTLQFIHAVRRPLTKPAGHWTVARKAGDAWASLRGSGDPLLGVDPRSTGQVDIAAEWREFRDTDIEGRRERVVSFALARAASALPELRHEFGDTRHRRLTYTLTAVSRFRQFFNDDADEAFHNIGALPEVSIPSSARPAPPVVLAATPAFRWEGSPQSLGLAAPVLRKRLGGRIRIELARPWYSSGQDERLAVVVKPTGLPPSASLDRHFTRIQRDPIWATGSAVGLAQASMFEGLADPARECGLADVAVRGVAMPFAVRFDDSGDRWFADVQMPGAIGNSYNPFVRLVVARYQRESLDGCELSSAVTTDFVQLLPDRTLSIDAGAGVARILLEGIGPFGPRPNRVVARLEQAFPDDAGAVSDITSASPDIPGMWHRLDGHSVSGVLGQTIDLPLPAAGGLLRIVVREVEDIEGATFVEDDGPLAGDLRERTVFFDVIRI